MQSFKNANKYFAVSSFYICCVCLRNYFPSVLLLLQRNYEYKKLTGDKSTAVCPDTTRWLLPRYIAVDPIFPVAALSSKIEKESY